MCYSDMKTHTSAGLDITLYTRMQHVNLYICTRMLYVCKCERGGWQIGKILLSLSAITQGALLASQGLFSNHKHLEGLSRVFVCASAEPWHQIILTRNFNEGFARHQMSGARRVAWVTFKQCYGARIKRTRQPLLTFSFALSDFNERVFFHFFFHPIHCHQYVFSLISIKRCP